MSILFGHPTGNPNSHHAALAHFEAGRLEAFCVAWMPTPDEINALGKLPGLDKWSARLQRRSFPPLLSAPLIQGRLGEWKRMVQRIFQTDKVAAERLAYEANDWLMQTMRRECARSRVSAVHSYEDCSLWQFREAKRLDKACIYDMPIGCYPAWKETQRELAGKYADWLPNKLSFNQFARPEQKDQEMQLADLVLVPSTFVRETVLRFHDKSIALAKYGVDADFWIPNENRGSNGRLRFIYVGHISVRKGIPVLLQAWKNAALKDAELVLIGQWQILDNVRAGLMDGVRHFPAMSAFELRKQYQSSDVFVFPSFFEGFALVLLEAMACGVPAMASDHTGAPDIIDSTDGWVLPAGNVDAWAAAFQNVSATRDKLPAMKKAARDKAVKYSWSNYRQAVSQAVDSLA